MQACGVMALDNATLDRLRVQISPSAFYLRVDDNIRITSYNGLAGVQLAIRTRFLDLTGEIFPSAELQTPNTDRSAKSTIFVTPEGWLLGGQIFAIQGTPQIGQTYVVVEVVQGLGASAIPLQTLAAGYVTSKQPLSWPGAPIQSSLEFGGALRSITGTTPAAGAEITEAVPTNARWELLAFRAQLVTDANVANRSTSLTLDDGSLIYFHSAINNTQAASLTHKFAWGQGLLTPFTAQISFNLAGLPIGIRLGPAHRIRTVTGLIQVGDQYSAVQYLVRECIEGA